jgi:glycosyltransferase involved in cell wall biosynthesis
MGATINILVVSSKYPPEYSGSGLRCHNTYLRLKKKYAINYKVLSSSVIDNRSSTYEIDGVSVKRISLKPFNSTFFLNYRSSNRLIDVLSKLIGKIFYRLDYFTEASLTFVYLIRLSWWYDLIHIFGNVNVTAATLTFSKIFNKKVVYEVVNFYNNKDYDPLAYYEPLFVKLLFGREFRQHWQVIAISKILEELCQRHNPTANIIHRPNPVNELKFRPVSQQTKISFRNKLSQFAESDILIINIAKFIPLKNQILIVEALQHLPENYKLLLVGPLVEDGPLVERDHDYFQSINKLIEKLVLKDRVQIKTGFFENVEKYFQLSDIFAFPTTNEALGTPMLESLSCAVPVVMTRIKGVSDVWIDDGINGYLSELDAKEFAEKILLSQKLKQEELNQKSKEILDIASTSAIDEQYMQIFNKLRHYKL